MKKTVIGAMVGVLAIFGLVLGTQNVSAYSCPAGTPGANRGEVSNLAECSLSDTENTFMSTLTKIINVVLAVLGIVAVMMIIMGGVTYVTSNGDAAKLTKAKNTIIYSVIGLVIALLAFAIVNFVLSSVFSSDSSKDTASCPSGQTYNKDTKKCE